MWILNKRKEMLGLKRFNMPRMERINLASMNTIVASACNNKYCCGFECNACDKDDTECWSVSACTVHNCKKVLCPYYEGTAC